MQVVSPVPPADELKKLKETLPTGPERVFAMAEKALEHRIEMEKNTGKTEEYLATRSIWFAFFISCLGIICSTGLILTGHTVVGTILSAGTFGTIIASFMSIVSAKKDSEPLRRERRNPEKYDESRKPAKPDQNLQDSASEKPQIMTSD